MEGVTHVSPYIENKVGISTSSVQEGVLMMGLDPDKEKGVSDIFEYLTAGVASFDTLESSKGRRYPGILVGSGLFNKMRLELGEEVSCVGVARRYQGLCDVMVIDHADAAHAPAVEALGMRAVVTNTVMTSDQDKAALAQELLGVVEAWDGRGP